MYMCFAQHIDTEGLDEASLLELQNKEDSFSTNLDKPEHQVTRSNNRSNLRARRVRDAFTVYFNSDVGQLPETVTDYNSADECVRLMKLYVMVMYYI